MHSELESWLDQHRQDVVAHWQTSLSDLTLQLGDANEGDAGSNGGRDFCESLVNVLIAPAEGERSVSTMVRDWVNEQLHQRGIAPTALVLATEQLFQTIHHLMPSEQTNLLNGQLKVMHTALLHSLAAEVERLIEENHRLETVQNITAEITSSLDVGRMLYRTLQQLLQAGPADRGAIFLLNEDHHYLQSRMMHNWKLLEPADTDRSGPISIPLSSLPADWQLGRVEESLLFTDIASTPPPDWAQPLVAQGARSLILVPLVANGAFNGLLMLASPRGGVFTAAYHSLVAAVARQIATAIGNAEVYQLITRQAQELGQMLRFQQEESTKNQSILTSIADGVVFNDTTGQTIMVNPAAERILEIPAEELTGQDFQALFVACPEKSRREVTTAMESLLGTPEAELRKAYKTILEIGGRVVMAHLSPVRTERNKFLGVVTVLRDVTKEVEADRAKSEFVSNVSHELRTPMTAIKGYTDLLHAGAVGPINEDQERFLEIIKNNADRLTALINDLLDISRVETGRVRFEPRLMQIADVIADVVNVLAVQAEEKHQTLTYQVAAGLPEIMGDRDRLHQVITNLVGNAIHYTPEGGRVEVQAYAVEGAVRVDVTDTGIGIAPDDLPHIFERFYRADDPLVQEAAGTGLGLSIVKMFVEMHGGRVWVESEPGKGSTFTFILPVPVSKEDEERREVSRQSRRLIARTRSILVVDDDPDVAQLIKMQLESSGYSVFLLGRGGAVVSWAEKKQPDLIILDVILPDMADMDGLDVLRELKANAGTADIPVIVLSIKQDDGTAWALGAVDYLTKPVDGQALLRSVQDALTWQGRVLVVEDDPDTVGFLSSTMRRIGFTPLVASNGYEALAIARRYRPDLILLDLRLPGMDGYESLTHLKRDAVTQTIPIIAVSAHVADIDQERKRLIALGASSFLPKPFSIDKLLAEVEEVLQPITPPVLPGKGGG